MGAGMSFADMCSDVYITNQYYSTGRASVANTLVGLIGANLLLQAGLVFVQTHGLKGTRRQRWKRVFFELLSVVTLMKPGVDAYRVASGAEQQPGAAVNPLEEMVGTKVFELVLEAVPGLVLQLVALLRVKEKTRSAIVSVFFSAVSAAMTATTVCWDVETDPGSKKRNPEW
jgi:hypothetical protein